MVQLLDVTLRDGGYINQFNFSIEEAKKIVSGLHKSRVDWIEVGYRNGPAKGSAGLGITAETNDAYIKALREHSPNANLVVMLHPHNVNSDDIHALYSLGVSLVRICIRKDHLEEALETIRECKKNSLKISANFVRITNFTNEQITDMALMAEAAGADLIYFADSNGNLLPENVRTLTTSLKSVLKVQIGFHAHNNLSLGLANTIAALESGIDWLDSSLRGIGRSGGNLATEVFISYLERYYGFPKYKLIEVMDIAEYVQDKILISGNYLTPQIKDILLGMMNFSTDLMQPIMDSAKENRIYWKELMYELSKRNPNMVTNKEITEVANIIKKNKREFQHL
ncbi:4-hydroxy 2-oxovalerate aldolase [Paenibacillus sp. DS2015]|uniref:hypothetical protein n=1 Tax=Paenibacillus sp. DS2015 TaxID=3373917 RepID=UPI003D238AD8